MKRKYALVNGLLTMGLMHAGTGYLIFLIDPTRFIALSMTFALIGATCGILSIWYLVK